MLMEFIDLLGPWNWAIFGLVLLALEVMLPSTFLLWPGLAALVVGAVTLLLGTDNPVWPWQLQLIVFLFLSLLIAYFGNRYVKQKNIEASEADGLNERGSQLVGKTGVISDPIVNGQGRMKIGDTTWRVSGPDTKQGQSMKVVDYDSGTLVVEKP